MLKYLSLKKHVGHTLRVDVREPNTITVCCIACDTVVGHATCPSDEHVTQAVIDDWAFSAMSDREFLYSLLTDYASTMTPEQRLEAYYDAGLDKEDADHP